METRMLKLITAILALFSFSNLFAETYYVTGTVQSIEPVYSSTNIYTPETRCRNVKVPVYGKVCLLYTSPSPRDMPRSRMPSSA